MTDREDRMWLLASQPADPALPTVAAAIHDYRRRMATLIARLDEVHRAVVGAAEASPTNRQADLAGMLAVLSVQLRTGDGRLGELAARLEPSGAPHRTWPSYGAA